MYIARLQDIRRGEVLLFRGEGDITRRGDAEIAAFVLIEESAEDGGRVEIWPWMSSISARPRNAREEGLAST
jgi:hypothetical protein